MLLTALGHVPGRCRYFGAKFQRRACGTILAPHSRCARNVPTCATWRARGPTENTMKTRRSALVCLPLLWGISCSTDHENAGAGHVTDASITGSGGDNSEHVADASTIATGGPGDCPPPGDLLAFTPGCDDSGMPVIKINGPCSLGSAQDPRIVELQTHAAGTCHVDFTYPNGTTSAVDVTIISAWRPLGSDPHGCGQEFYAVTDKGARCSPGACLLPIPGQSCDAGT